MANFINFQTTTTTRISPINNAQRGITTPKSSIYATIKLIFPLSFKHFYILVDDANNWTFLELPNQNSR